MTTIPRSNFCVCAVIICLLTAFNVTAQQLKKAAKPEVAEAFKNRKLVVLLRSEDEAIAKKLNATELKNYKQSINQFNSDLEFVIKTFWTFNSSIAYLTRDKISALASPDQYAIISLDLINVRLSNQLIGKGNQILRLNVCFLEDYDPLKPIFYQDIVGLVTEQFVPVPRKMDIIAATHVVQNHLAARREGKPRRNGTYYDEAIEHAGTLKSKILLIDTAFMDAKLTEADIKANYEYPFEISNQKSIEKAQISKDNKYAYVYLFSVGDASNQFSHFILDCNTGNVISYSMRSGFHMNNFIDAGHLKDYVLYSDYYNNKKKKK